LALSSKFDPSAELIIVHTRVFGPRGKQVDVRLALDTGATQTVISPTLLRYLEYRPFSSRHRIQITTGSGIETSPLLLISKISALGKTRKHLPVLCHDLPPSSGVDGLLGLDFFRARNHRETLTLLTWDCHSTTLRLIVWQVCLSAMNMALTCNFNDTIHLLTGQHLLKHNPSAKRGGLFLAK